MWFYELWFTLGICPVVGLLGHMVILFLVFFNDTATTEIYTLSLHDALPIYTDGPEAHEKVLNITHY